MHSEGYGSYIYLVVIKPGPVYNPVSFRAPGEYLAEGNRTPGFYSRIYGMFSSHADPRLCACKILTWNWGSGKMRRVTG